MYNFMKRCFLILLAFLILFCFVGCEEKYESAPQIAEGEFPFVVEYEFNGERYLIEDTVVCSWDGYDMSNNFAIFGYPYSRIWDASLKSRDESKRVLIEFEPNAESLLVDGRNNIESRVILSYGSGGYYLGDPNDTEYYPRINYIENYEISSKMSKIDSTKLSNDQLEKLFGIKIIRFEFSEPIENKFE